MLVKFLRGKVAASRKFQAGDTAELNQSDLFYLREGHDYEILPSGNSPAEATASPEPPQVAPDEIAEPEQTPEEAPKKKRGRPAKNQTN